MAACLYYIYMSAACVSQKPHAETSQISVYVNYVAMA